MQHTNHDNIARPRTYPSRSCTSDYRFAPPGHDPLVCEPAKKAHAKCLIPWVGQPKAVRRRAIIYSILRLTGSRFPCVKRIFLKKNRVFSRVFGCEAMLEILKT